MGKAFRRFIPDQDLALRVFLAVYFLLTAIFWAGGWPLLAPGWSLIRFFADDLSGLSRGLDTSVLFFDLGVLRRSPAAAFAVVTLVASGCILLIRARFRLAGASVLIVAGQLMGYSMGGRIIHYDIVSFSLFGYWIGLLAAPLLQLGTEDGERLPWLCGAAGLLSTFFSAALAKLAIPYFDWCSPIRVGLILHTARFRYEMGVAPFSPPGFLVEYFDHPRLLGTLLLAMVLLGELLAAPAVFLGSDIWIFFWLMLALSLGMFFFTTVAFFSVIGLFLVLAVPWNRLAGIPASRLSARATRFAFVLSLSFVAIDWAAPTGAETRNSSKLWPFATFNMYAWPANEFTLYFLKDETGALVNPRILKEEIRASIVPLNTQLNARFGLSSPKQEAAMLICDRLVAAPEGGRLRNHAWTVWSRYVRIGEDEQKLSEKNAPMLTCRWPEPRRG